MGKLYDFGLLDFQAAFLGNHIKEYLFLSFFLM